MTRLIECDKCGRSDLAPLCQERFAVEVKLPAKTVSVDLCERCAVRLERWLADRDPLDARE
jgi:hypothetical protein